MPFAHIPTGLKSFDELIPDCPGIPRGCITVVSGEVGTGKTEFLLQTARHALRQGISVYYSDPVDNLRRVSFWPEDPVLGAPHSRSTLRRLRLSALLTTLRTPLVVVSS